MEATGAGYGHLIRIDVIDVALFVACNTGDYWQKAAADQRIEDCAIAAHGFAHGTKFLSDEQIEAQYGVERRWQPATTFLEAPLATWNGPVALKLRSLLDYFDMPAALAFPEGLGMVRDAKVL